MMIVSSVYSMQLNVHYIHYVRYTHCIHYMHYTHYVHYIHYIHYVHDIFHTQSCCTTENGRKDRRTCKQGPTLVSTSQQDHNRNTVKESWPSVWEVKGQSWGQGLGCNDLSIVPAGDREQTQKDSLSLNVNTFCPSRLVLCSSVKIAKCQCEQKQVELADRSTIK